MSNRIGIVFALTLMACGGETLAPETRQETSPAVTTGADGANGKDGATGPQGPQGEPGKAIAFTRGELVTNSVHVTIASLGSAGAFVACADANGEPMPDGTPITGGCVTNQTGDNDMRLTSSAPSNTYERDGGGWLCVASNDAADREGELIAYVQCVMP